MSAAGRRRGGLASAVPDPRDTSKGSDTRARAEAGERSIRAVPPPPPEGSQKAAGKRGRRQRKFQLNRDLPPEKLAALRARVESLEVRPVRGALEFSLSCEEVMLPGKKRKVLVHDLVGMSCFPFSERAERYSRTRPAPAAETGRKVDSGNSSGVKGLSRFACEREGGPSTATGRAEKSTEEPEGGEQG